MEIDEIITTLWRVGGLLFMIVGFIEMNPLHILAGLLGFSIAELVEIKILLQTERKR